MGKKDYVYVLALGYEVNLQFAVSCAYRALTAMHYNCRSFEDALGVVVTNPKIKISFFDPTTERPFTRTQAGSIMLVASCEKGMDKRNQLIVYGMAKVMEVLVYFK